jgi:DNA repair exonuclease SbcCD ATPase subunit
MHTDVDVESVADELYGLPPGEFTAARDARSTAAKRAGDRDLAAAIKRLGRPTAAAWLANLLVRERTEQVEQLLELGAAMREAQAELAGDQMRQLALQRRQIVSALGREAGQLAVDRGQPVSRSIREEMEGTLEAALADPDAGEALSSGRLTTSLRYTGLGSVDVAGAVAATPRPAAKRPVSSTSSKKAAAPEPDDREAEAEAERRRLERVEAAEQRLASARDDAAEAKRVAEDKERTVREVQERVDGLRRQLDELEQQMQRLQGEEKFAAKNLREVDRARRTAADALRRAKGKVAEAEAGVASLVRRPNR